MNFKDYEIMPSDGLANKTLHDALDIPTRSCGGAFAGAAKVQGQSYENTFDCTR